MDYETLRTNYKNMKNIINDAINTNKILKKQNDRLIKMVGLSKENVKEYRRQNKELLANNRNLRKQLNETAEPVKEIRRKRAFNKNPLKEFSNMETNLINRPVKKTRDERYNKNKIRYVKDKEMFLNALGGNFKETIVDENENINLHYPALGEYYNESNEFKEGDVINPEETIFNHEETIFFTELYNKFKTIIEKEISLSNTNKDVRKKDIFCYISVNCITSRLEYDEYMELLQENTPEYMEQHEINWWWHSKVFILRNSQYNAENIETIILLLIEEIAKIRSSRHFIRVYDISYRFRKAKAVLGSSYIKLPDYIYNKQCCTNIKNTDLKCFEWCLIADKCIKEKLVAINYSKKHEPRTYKKFMDVIKIPDDIEYPVSIKDIHKYEELNGIKINVFKLSEKESQIIEHLYVSNTRNENILNLLYIEQEGNGHYVIINNLNALRPDTHHTRHICPQCLSKSYNTRDKLDEHMKLCLKYDSQKVEFPEKGKNILQFNNKGNEFMHPFNIVADFESTLLKCEIENGQVIKYQKHIPNSYGIKFNCIHNEYSEDIKIYNNEDPEKVVENFILDLERLAKKAYTLTQLNKVAIIASKVEELKHSRLKNCEECNCEFTINNKKVKHHDHISGKYIKTLCNECNLNYQYKKFIPVLIHNLKGYDCHLFINGLVKYGYKEDKLQNIKCIPNNEERYISLSKSIVVDYYTDKKTKQQKPVYYEIRFLDTFAFMASSIESLSNNLSKGIDDIKTLRENFKYTGEYFKNDNEFLEMIKKGVYPYDWMDNYGKMYETRILKQKYFNSMLNKSQCDNEDYEQYKKVYKLFNCKNFMEYHNLYLKSDVLLLSDIWYNFTKTCYGIYNLDPAYYYTAPSLSWDAFLRFSKCEIELLTDGDMYLFVEDAIRGGISQISHRYAEANNKYMKDYDNSKCESNIIYLDANNLYGDAMTKFLPQKDFKWNTEEWTTEKILNLKDDDKTGYLFNVDLEYPEELHDTHNNYPLCPERLCVNKNDLNKWQTENYKENKIEKLILTLRDKNNYTCNYRYLKLVLSLGLKLKKVNKVLQYTQSDFMKSYIMLNTNMRTKAKNDFEKDFYKLMNNSVFGKTMENVRNRINFRLISNEEQAFSLRNEMKNFTIFNENLVGIHMQKDVVKLNKPIFIGQNILDQSKHLMADFHYNFMLKKIPRENIDLLFTDTDSLCYSIRNNDIYEIIKDNKEYFDLSEYSEKHPIFSNEIVPLDYEPKIKENATEEEIEKIINQSKTEDGLRCLYIQEIKNKNMKVIGKMKDETKGIPITQFIGLRSKLYSYKVDGEKKDRSKCKGVKKAVVKNEIKFEDYKTTLTTRESKNISQNGIRSYKHQLYSETQTKTALSCNDDKVFICDNNINTYNFGHKNIKVIQQINELQ